MRADLKHLHFRDRDIESSIELNEDNVLEVDAYIGTSGEDASQIFSLTVCTPEYFAKRLEQESVVNGRGYLIMNAFNEDKLRSYIDRFCSKCWGDSWEEIERKLEFVGRSEFEDYQE
ncbi:Imm8 family immunity protein [Leptospira wolffii]|uniref:Imm8 family immunity protein n=1 Tax=Leptospira wolffii TaxID=409998 RepID=UPI00058E731C|nr:Imm8 family immunity protein [Leptospira wolffii]